MWQSSNTIRTGHDATHSTLLPGGQYARGHDVTHSTLLPGRQYARGRVFILVYRLAIDAKTLRGDDGAD